MYVRSTCSGSETAAINKLNMYSLAVLTRSSGPREMRKGGAAAPHFAHHLLNNYVFIPCKHCSTHQTGEAMMLDCIHEAWGEDEKLRSILTRM